jgi:hypothetical protein
VTDLDKNKKQLVIVLVGALWVTLLLFLTPLLALATGRFLQKTDIEVEERNNPVIFNIDEVYLSKNIFGDILIAGWAFIENSDDNPDKQINFIFASTENTYLIETTTIDRFDLRVASILSDFEVPISRNGFEGNFSPVMMKNGDYHLYLQVIENTALIAIADTGRVFSKNYNKFEEDIGGREVSIYSDRATPDIVVNTHFTCIIEESMLKVEGWAFSEVGGLGILPARPLVKLKRSDGSIAYFSTISDSRIDVAREFDNLELLLSGFSAVISTNNLGSGENTISVIFDGLGESVFTCKVPF